MAPRRSGSKAVAVRLVALLVLGVIALVAVMVIRSPMAIHENEVRRMLTTGELIGLPVEEAAQRLHHRPPDPPVMDGTVVFEFGHVRGWRAASVEVEVRGGRVVSAQWAGTVAEEYR